MKHDFCKNPEIILDLFAAFLAAYECDCEASYIHYGTVLTSEGVEVEVQLKFMLRQRFPGGFGCYIINLCPNLYHNSYVRDPDTWHSLVSINHMVELLKTRQYLYE